MLIFRYDVITQANRQMPDVSSNLRSLSPDNPEVAGARIVKICIRFLICVNILMYFMVIDAVKSLNGILWFISCFRNIIRALRDCCRN